MKEKPMSAAKQKTGRPQKKVGHKGCTGDLFCGSGGGWCEKRGCRECLSEDPQGVHPPYNLICQECYDELTEETAEHILTAGVGIQEAAQLRSDAGGATYEACYRAFEKAIKEFDPWHPDAWIRSALGDLKVEGEE